MHALRVCTGAKGGCTCQRKCGERVAPIFGNGLMTNAFEICQTNSRARTSSGNHNLQRNDPEKAPASSPLKRDGVAELRADGVTGSDLLLREQHSSNLSFGWSVYTTYKLVPSGRSMVVLTVTPLGTTPRASLCSTRPVWL